MKHCDSHKKQVFDDVIPTESFETCHSEVDHVICSSRGPINNDKAGIAVPRLVGKISVFQHHSLIYPIRHCYH